MQTTEKNYIFRLTGSIKEADRCLQCYDAPCTKGCPAGVNVKRFVGLAQKGEYSAAAAVIKRDNPLGLTCGYVCPSAATCQKNCISARLGKPIDIRAIQAYTMEMERRRAQGGSGDAEEHQLRLNCRGEISAVSWEKTGSGRVAVVGGGPAGLSAAWYLHRFGYAVTLFEESERLGGRLVRGIPSFRIHRQAVEEEIAAIAREAEIRTGAKLGREFTVESLLADGYRGVVLAVGKMQGKTLPLKGADKKGVYEAEEILTTEGWKANGHRAAVVIGAGNVAMDVARTLVRSGVEQVSICYRGGNLQVKAIQEEREEAYQENITLQLYAMPEEVLGEGRAEGVKFYRSQLANARGEGASARPLEEKYAFTVPADMVVFAVGYALRQEDLRGSGVTVEGDAVKTKGTYTGIPGVYAAGDMIGGRTVVEAVGQGKTAALALHEYLTKEEHHQ